MSSLISVVWITVVEDQIQTKETGRLGKIPLVRKQKKRIVMGTFCWQWLFWWGDDSRIPKWSTTTTTSASMDD